MIFTFPHCGSEKVFSTLLTCRINEETPEQGGSPFRFFIREGYFSESISKKKNVCIKGPRTERWEKLARSDFLGQEYVAVQSSLIKRSAGPKVVSATVCPGMSFKMVQLSWVRGQRGMQS